VRIKDIDDQIVGYMSFFVTNVELFVAIKRYDINRVAQNFLIPLFAEIYRNWPVQFFIWSFGRFLDESSTSLGFV
jgi:hypothetical protein